jgi:hypothetical protein
MKTPNVEIGGSANNMTFFLPSALEYIIRLATVTIGQFLLSLSYENYEEFFF